MPKSTVTDIGKITLTEADKMYSKGISKDIIFEIKNGFRGLYTLDLKPYDIYLDKEMGDIAVTIQWIESVKENEESKFLAISTAMSATETSFYREKNMSSWHKSGQSLTFYLNTFCQ